MERQSPVPRDRGGSADRVPSDVGDGERGSSMETADPRSRGSIPLLAARAEPAGMGRRRDRMGRSTSSTANSFEVERKELKEVGQDI